LCHGKPPVVWLGKTSSQPHFTKERNFHVNDKAPSLPFQIRQ
jgi:hypothetical protein